MFLWQSIIETCQSLSKSQALFKSLITLCFLIICLEITLPTNLIEAIMIASSRSSSISISGRIQVSCFIYSISSPISISDIKIRFDSISRGHEMERRMNLRGMVWKMMLIEMDFLFQVNLIRNWKMIEKLFIRAL